MKNINKTILSIICALLSSCSSQEINTPIPITPSATEVLDTPTPLPPTVTPTPKITFPVSIGTVFPSFDEQIISANAEQIKKIAIWEGGTSRIGRWVYSPDGKYLIASGFLPDGKTYLYDPATFELNFELDWSMIASTISPDGKYVAVYTWPGIEIKSMSDFKTLAHNTTFEFERRGIGDLPISFMPNSTKIIVNQKDKIQIWDWKQNKIEEGLLEGIDIPIGIEASAISPDNQYFAIAYYGNATIYSLQTKEVVKGYPLSRSEDVRALRFMPNNSLAIEYRDSTQICDFINGAKQVYYTGSGNTLSMSPDGKHIVSGTDRGWVYFYDLENQTTVYLKGHGGRVNFAAISPNGDTAITGGEDGKIKYWSLQDYSVVKEIENSFGVIKNIDFATDGMYLTVQNPSEVLFLDVQTGEIKNRFSDNISDSSPDTIPGPNETELVIGVNDIDAYALSPDGKFIGLGGNYEFSIWNLEAKEKIFSFPDTFVGKHVTFSPDSRLFAALEFDGLYVWDIETKQQILFQRFYAAPTMVKFSPESSVIVASSGLSTESVLFIDVKTKEIVAKSTGHTIPIVFAFSPDGKQAVTLTDKTLTYWNTTTWRKENQVDIPYDNGTLDITYSPDGTMLVFQSYEYNGNSRNPLDIIFWDVIANQEVFSFSPPFGFETSFDFSPDGKYFVISGYETIELWGILNK